MAIVWPILRRLSGPLTIRCSSCGRTVRWPRDAAIGLLGDTAMPHDVRRRLRCGICGARGVDGHIAIDGEMR
jgi:hypothetical protein